jgi:hypothetical protein
MIKLGNETGYNARDFTLTLVLVVM